MVQAFIDTAFTGIPLDQQNRIFAKCAWRLIPLMLVLYFVNYLDRVNVAFAALTMNKDLAISSTVYGIGAGILFVGYFLFQIPANLILERIGARRWIFIILLTWGALSAANALVQGPLSLLVLRFFLGAAEAGLYPGLIFYLTLWFPPAYRARVTGNFLIGLPLAFVIGAPLSGFILEMNGLAGVRGWQWLFLLEGLPACVLAFLVLKMLPDSPQHAAWLSADEKSVIASSIAASPETKHAQWWQQFGDILSDVRVWALGLVYLADQSAASGSRFFMPQILQGMGYSNLETTYIVALPFVVAMPAMFYWGRSSDLRNERVWHVAIPMLLTAASFLVVTFANIDLVVVFALCLSMIWPLMFLGSFWGFNSLVLGGRGAAGSIAWVSALGSLGGLVGPATVGALKDATGTYGAGLMAIAAALILATVTVLSLMRVKVPERPAIPARERG